jgi:hypothetical protein
VALALGAEGGVNREQSTTTPHRGPASTQRTQSYEVIIKFILLPQVISSQHPFPLRLVSAPAPPRDTPANDKPWTKPPASPRDSCLAEEPMTCWTPALMLRVACHTHPDAVCIL